MARRKDSRQSYYPLDVNEANGRASRLDECLAELPLDVQSAAYAWLDAVVQAFNDRAVERGQVTRLGPAAAKELLYLKLTGALVPVRSDNGR